MKEGKHEELTLYYKGLIYSNLENATAIVTKEGNILSTNRRWKVMSKFLGNPSFLLKSNNLFKTFLSKNIILESDIEKLEKIYHWITDNKSKSFDLEIFIPKFGIWANLVLKKIDLNLVSITVKLDPKKHYKSFFDSSALAFILTDTEGNILTFNPTAIAHTIRFFNRRIQNSENIYSYILTTNKKSFEENFSFAKKGNRVQMEVQFYVDIDEIKYYLLNINPVSGLSNSFQYFTFELIDITHTKEIENQLFHTNLILKEASQVANLGAWYYDFKIQKLTLSDDVYRILHLNKIENPDIKLNFISRNRNFKDSILTAINECLTTEKEWDLELPYELQNGNLIWIRSLGKPIKINNNAIRLVGIIMEVTDKKNQDIERGKLINDLIFKNKELLQFSYILSHNIRAPMANILGLISVIEHNNISPHNQKVLELINQASFKMDDIIRDLGHILNLKDTNVNKELLQFKTIYDSTLSILSNKIIETSAIVTSDFKSEKYVYCLKSYLENIFYNILSNAIKYKHKDRILEVHFRTYSENNYIVLSAKDNGLGIDTVFFKDKLFGLYNRFHDHIEGKGMGMFMIKTQVEAMGGYVEFESTPNIGSEIKVYLRK